MKYPRFRKKPVVIEALRYTGDNLQEMATFMGVKYPSTHEKNLVINTLEGFMEARPWDYVIKGVKGEFYPVKPDIFEVTYEKVE